MKPEQKAHSEKTVFEAQWLAADEALRDAISRFATQARFEEEFLNAFLEFWGVDDLEELPIDLEEETPEFLLAFEWYLYDYHESESGRRMIELFSEVEGSRLAPLQGQLLQQWAPTYLSPYEVVSVRPGFGYLVRSILDGQEKDVEDGPTSREMKPGDLVVARLLPAGKHVRPSSVFRTFSQSDLPRLKAILEGYFQEYGTDHPGADWAAFLRDEGYLFNDYALERQALAERMAEAPESLCAGESDWDLDEQTPEEVAEVTGRLDRCYLDWLDRVTPALDELTPRQAVSIQVGREKVIAILQEMGEIEASYALVGEPAFEVASLLPELELQIGDLQ